MDYSAFLGYRWAASGAAANSCDYRSVDVFSDPLLVWEDDLDKAVFLWGNAWATWERSHIQGACVPLEGYTTQQWDL